MSYENREREYKRLKSLGRDKDICQSLRDEFEKATEEVATPIQPKKETKKKGKK